MQPKMIPLHSVKPREAKKLDTYDVQAFNKLRGKKKKKIMPWRVDILKGKQDE